jgi:hypothetical protein
VVTGRFGQDGYQPCAVSKSSVDLLLVLEVAKCLVARLVRGKVAGRRLVPGHRKRGDAAGSRCIAVGSGRHRCVVGERHESCYWDITAAGNRCTVSRVAVADLIAAIAGAKGAVAWAIAGVRATARAEAARVALATITAFGGSCGGKAQGSYGRPRDQGEYTGFAEGVHRSVSITRELKKTGHFDPFALSYGRPRECYSSR